MQLWPHDGVAALALSAPAAPRPPTRVSVAVAASTLLLMDMDGSLSWNSQPHPAHGCVELAPAARIGFFPDRSARCRLAVARPGPYVRSDRSCSSVGAFALPIRGRVKRVDG